MIRKKLIPFFAAALVLAGVLALAPRTTEAGSIGPDVTVFDLNGVRNWGALGGVRAYSVGTVSCNIGDEPLWWCDHDTAYCEDDQHPVIAQNLYRLKEGRFEQLGMSWLKHGFLSVNSSNSECGDGSCANPPHGGDQLGVGCTDPYGSTLNGDRPLGMRSEVNATTGVLDPYPFTIVPSPLVIDQRIQVEEAELDPLLNPGARYWVEGHYVAADDAGRGNGLNNASYREVSVNAASFNLGFVAPTVRQKAAIYAWQEVDPGVEIVNADTGAPAVERFHVARRATPADGGSWHYEYAVHNLCSDRSARSLTIRFPAATAITGVGFHDVDHHSGEPYDTMDWQATTDADSVTWFTDTVDVDENANALRWGTMFSFWFDAAAPPIGLEHTLTLFENGVPETLELGFDSGIFYDGFESGDTSAW